MRQNLSFCTGSPPHTWRILFTTRAGSRVVRITSTHVENTSLLFVSCWCSRDHLHTRGEYSTLFNVGGVHKGSPPHTWRILFLMSFLPINTRITSTHVENTFLVLLLFDHCQDHLHTRGEYFFGKIKTMLHIGSPPHTWRILP